jgi:hypothetical protein
MKKEIIDYAKGLNANDITIDWLEKNITNEHDIGKTEHIIDFLIYKDFDNLNWANYDLLLEKSKKWIKQLSQNVIRIDEEYGIDIGTVLDFEDGFRFVKLISEKAYRREGSLMSHCVASYYGREVEIYSLRDEFNKPHCTIEKDVQIKGKGNGDIHPKYIDYVVRFLEFTGIKVRDSEMKNLGYTKISFKEHVLNIEELDLYRDKYIRKTKEEIIKYDLDKIKIFTDKKELFNYKGNKIKCFKGDLDCSHNELTSLPDNLHVERDLDCSHNKLTSLPDNLHVERDLYCSHNEGLKKNVNS